MYEYRYLIVAGIAIIVIALLQWEKTKTTVYNVMLRAKDLAKDKVLSCGREQEDWVVAKLKLILPKPITIFLGEDMLRTLVRFLYGKGLDYLDDGKFNNSNK